MRSLFPFNNDFPISLFPWRPSTIHFLPFTLYCPQSSSLFFCSDFLTAICTFLVLLSSYFLCYAGCFSYFPAVANLSASFLSSYSKLPCDGFSTCILLYFLVCVSPLYQILLIGIPFICVPLHPFPFAFHSFFDFCMHPGFLLFSLSKRVKVNYLWVGCFG